MLLGTISQTVNQSTTPTLDEDGSVISDLVKIKVIQASPRSTTIIIITDLGAHLFLSLKNGFFQTMQLFAHELYLSILNRPPVEACCAPIHMFSDA